MSFSNTGKYRDQELSQGSYAYRRKPLNNFCNKLIINQKEKEKIKENVEKIKSYDS